MQKESKVRIGAFNIKQFEVHLDKKMIEKLVTLLLKSYSVPYSCLLSQSTVPYVARFQYLKNPHIRITLIGCHTHPDSAYEEIKALVNEVYVDIKARLEKSDSFSVLLYCFESSYFGSNDDEPIIIMGDFNASGSYLKKEEQNKLDNILHKNGLVWRIGHSSDTTITSKCNTYDRFVFEVKNKRR
ncbi:3137_t:CDS:2 [Racocetra persica]|uniref:3137_t:CDS:1 n=1 Tax=Racocetra persica TaxID=160502 RepID=A0ACA9N1N9_9GLOM|nr:3137_t:CDS:2 [Racocetra persica]